MRPATLFACLLHALCLPIAWLPVAVLEGIGAVLGEALYALGGREARVTVRNLELTGVALDSKARVRLARAVLRRVGGNGLLTLRVWSRPWGSNRRLIADIEGEALLDAALAAGRGVIIAAPHVGNWELLSQYLATRAPIHVLFRPPDSAIADAFVRRVRQRPGIAPVPAERRGMRQLLHALAAGGMLGILPDQRPKAGEGSFAPFFGIETCTMTLLTRLARRTGAGVLFASSERIACGRYRIRIEGADPAIADADERVALSALNAGIERIARRDPVQYQWNYKRFSQRPPGSGEADPYRS